MTMKKDINRNNYPLDNLVSAVIVSLIINFFLAIVVIFLLYEIGFSIELKRILLYICIVILYIIAICLHLIIYKKAQLTANRQRIIYFAITFLGMIPKIWTWFMIIL